MDETGVVEELEGVEKGSVFGRVLDLDTLKIDMSPDVMIPGVAVASSRATPLAGTHLSSLLLSASCNVCRLD